MVLCINWVWLVSHLMTLTWLQTNIRWSCTQLKVKLSWMAKKSNSKAGSWCQMRIQPRLRTGTHTHGISMWHGLLISRWMFYRSEQSKRLRWKLQSFLWLSLGSHRNPASTAFCGLSKSLRPRTGELAFTSLLKKQQAYIEWSELTKATLESTTTKSESKRCQIGRMHPRMSVFWIRGMATYSSGWGLSPLYVWEIFIHNFYRFKLIQQQRMCHKDPEAAKW